MTFDTSALIALFDRRERHHPVMLRFAAEERGPLVVPIGILGEVCYFVERALGAAGLKAFFEDIGSGIYTLHCGESLIDRVVALIDRYKDLPLGYADAAVIACAERHGGRVATLDHRHFSVVAREGTIQIVP